jgi:hypothetical protein
VADLSLTLSTDLAERLERAVDREAKIPGALQALGPIADRDVLLLDGRLVRAAERLAASGARVTTITADDLTSSLGAGSAGSAGSKARADVLVAAWSAFRGPSADELAAAQRLLRPGGRLLVVHDYGRDDVSRLMGPRPEYGEWSRRDGPFLGNGFKIRVVHSWWTFDSLDEARTFLADAFGEAGEQLGAGLKRPRLSYNVAVYHRSFEAA